MLLQCKQDPKLDNPCMGIICQHGGTCEDGICVCPDGYTGNLCQTPLTPKSLMINKITVTEFPPGSFDDFTNPDLYVAITVGEVISNNGWTSGFKENVIAGNSYEFQGTTLNDLNLAHTISLYDYDHLDADDPMSGIIFTPLNYSQNFPASIVLNNSSINTNIKLDVNWSF